MEHFHQLIKEVLNDNQPSALATIVDVQGSAYRREGASMVIKEDDTRMGVLSGGCLEKDLHYRAQEMFTTGKTDIYKYDLSAEDDLGWGLGAGCNGIISVLVRDIDVSFKNALFLLNKHLTQKDPVLFIQSMKDFTKYLFISRNGEKFGDWQDEIPSEVENIVHSTTSFYKFAESMEIGQENYFVQLLWPTPDLYIIGAGEDARPLARLAESTGYAVHVLDWREGLCSKVHFPSAHSLQVGKMGELIENISFSRLDSVVIMTHDFQRDIKIVRRLLAKPLFYLGILGSKNRTKRLLGGEVPDWIHSPIGLSIGAEGPAEIAVSIVAELIASKSGGMRSESGRDLSRRRQQSAYGNK